MIRAVRCNLALSLCISWALLVFGAGPVGAQDAPSAAAAYQAKDYAKVIELWGSHIEKLDRHQLSMLATSYSETGNHPLALKTYQARLSLNPKDVEAKHHIGLEYLKMNKEREAMTALREALDINPKYEPAYLDIATIYEKRKNKYELRLLFEDLVTKLGHKPLYITRLCELTTLDGQYELSKQYCNEGIQRAPGEARNRVYLAQTMKETGNLDEAAKLFVKAADSSSKSDFAQIAAADFFASQKNFLKAYSYNKRATVANPQSSKAWNGLGSNAMELQKYEEAHSAFAKSCAIDRSALVEVRRAAASFRQQKNASWQQKFELLSESCGMKN